MATESPSRPAVLEPVEARQAARVRRTRRFGPRSLRGRLAVLFALGSALLLVGSAGFLYVNLNRQLRSAVDRGLEQRADDIAADLRQGAVGVRQEEAFAQIVTPTGQVLDSSVTIAGDRPVLRGAELRRAVRGAVFLDRGNVAGLGDTARLLARPESAGDTSVVVIVGSSRDAIDRAQGRLALVLAIASPLLIAALAGGGWLLSGAALHPVERMTEEADSISAAETGRRLPQPPGDDEIAHLGRTLNAMLDRLEASFARERAFVDDASHELRTPISILRAEMELALMRPDDHAEVVQSLRSALEEIGRLSRLTDDLLALARAGAGTLALRHEAVNVRALAEEVAGRMSLEPGPQVDVSGPSSTTEADPFRLEQVITNLVANGRRYAASRVAVEVAEDGDSVTITVADDGPGFSPGFLPAAFDRFSRGDPARARAGEGGAGLGLAIAHAVVRAHGGDIVAENGPPLGGAVVTVTLPRSRVRSHS